MLVLTRKANETLFIGGDVRVTLIDVAADGRVKVGIEAPDSTVIMRGELLSPPDVKGSRRSLPVVLGPKPRGDK